MDSRTCLNKVSICEDLVDKSSKKSEECVIVKAKRNLTVDLAPITPDSYRENGDVPDFTSLTTVLRKPVKSLCFDSTIDENSSPRTPRDAVFDPFAPGPDHLLLAPIPRRYQGKLRRFDVARQLNFDLSPSKFVEDTVSISDEEIFHAVYENLLEFIVISQADCALSEISNMEFDFGVCQTPLMAPRLSGIADTCPPAPKRPSAKLWNIDFGLCRKLEF